jgi:hypothetical protein
MIEPRLNANGQPSADAVRTAIVERPKVTNANRGKVVPVTGYFTPAKFIVTGFRHPIEFETNQTPLRGAPITIQWIAIGTSGGVELVSDWITQGQISLDNLPLGKILAAAVKACAFTATTIAADEITEAIELNNGQTLIKKFNIANAPKFMKFRGLPPLTFTRIGGELVQVKKNTKALTAPSEVEAVHRADAAPMSSPQALKRIADLYRAAEGLGREGRGYRTIAEWIELKTNGVRPATTAQQMISLARKAGHLEKPKPKKTKPKQRGTK